MTSPFFLTRQTANLMEDFTRELKAGSALFLLYGESGVGKTRLLQELCRSRLADSRIYWFDLSEGGRSEDILQDNSLQDNSRDIEMIFMSAQQGDVIIADHFEMALTKTRHQLFVSWSTDGVDKQLNLVVASSTEGFNELRQLSQQYQVRVQSFQQLPFSTHEVDAFIGFYRFPDRPTGKLAIPASLRKQLVATSGAVGKIIDIVERDGTRIKSSPMTDPASIRQGKRIIATVLIVFVLVIIFGWYYLGHRTPTAELETGTESVAEADRVTEVVTQDLVKAKTATTAATRTGIVEAETSQQETSPVGVMAASVNQAQIEPSNTNRFQRELKKSYAWVTSKAASVGTMQILLLKFKTFDESVYYEYVDSLASKRVDTTQLKVFKTYTGGAEFYSVFYGEYVSRQAANKAKDELPEVLRNISPVGRSVGGILNEIRRLEAES